MDRLRRLLFDHRRLLAAVCAGLAVLAALASVRAEAPSTAPVVVSSRDLPSGTLLEASDLREVRLSPVLVPARAAARVDDVVGERLAGAVRRGEPVTDVRLLGPGALAGRPPGTVVATVRIADPAELEAVQIGGRVDVVAVVPDGPDGRPSARVVAEGVEVVATDPGAQEPGGAATLRVAAGREDAVRLAETAVDARMSVLGAGEVEE